MPKTGISVLDDTRAAAVHRMMAARERAVLAALERLEQRLGREADRARLRIHLHTDTEYADGVLTYSASAIAYEEGSSDDPET